MSLETDLLLDRRRLMRRLVFWRLLAVLAVLAAVAVALPELGVEPVEGAHVARLTVSGLITEDPKLVRTLDALADDPKVKALEVMIDSPGGTVAGGEALHDAIARVAARKPVAAIMGGVAASAAYMIAVAAQRIFCLPGTLTGSIGVMLEAPEISGLMAKLGIADEVLVSGPLKNQPSLTRPLSDEGRAMLQGLVKELSEQFIGLVAAGRHLPLERVRSLADGRPYTGQQAVTLGLADALGGEHEARVWLAEAKGIPLSLPVQDVETETLLQRVAEVSSRLTFRAILKALLGQSVALDSAWAL
jgi:protease-4